MTVDKTTKNTSECIRVVVRIRPLSKIEKTSKKKVTTVGHEEQGVVQVRNPALPDSELPKSFTFDSVLSQSCTQKSLYDKCAAPIVDSVLQGYNGTVFAYGQTGAGKTWTMEGDMSSDENMGIIPRAFQHIFDHVALSNEESEKYLIRASYFEIYNEEIRDLLSNTPKKALELKESKETGINVKNLTSIVVKTIAEINNVMNAGKENRAVASTNMNAGSSRSHSIFSIVVECCTSNDKGDHIRVGKLNLVDLAGSERQGKTGATGERLKEATKINLSLSALGNVISALVDGKSSHIPYRDSKLTRILRDSLGGNTKTVMCANAGPAEYNYDETLSTLRYANRAKNIKNKPIINEDPKDAMLREYQDEIVSLRVKLSEMTKIIDEPSKKVEVVVKGNVISGDDSNKKMIKELEKKSEKEKKDIEDRSNAKIQQLRNDHNQTAEERKALQEKLHSESKARIEMELQRKELEAKLKEMEAKVMIGGKMADKAAKQEAALRKAEQDLIARKELELALSRKMTEREEINMALEEKYSSLNEEVRIKTKKLKKLLCKYQEARTEIKDLQSEFQIEKNDMLETIRHLNRQLSLKELVISNFVPPREAKKFDDIKNGGRAVWNEDEDVWQIPNLHLSGNALAFNDTLGLPRYLMRPETEKAKLMRQTDQNPRWRQDNIINLQLEKPDRSTFDYDFPKSKNKLLAYLETSISDPLEEVKSTPTVEKEFPPNPYMRYKSHGKEVERKRSKKAKQSKIRSKNSKSTSNKHHFERPSTTL